MAAFLPSGGLGSDFAFVLRGFDFDFAFQLDGGGVAAAVQGVGGFRAHPFFCVDFGLEALQDDGAFGGDIGAAGGECDFKLECAALEFFKGGARACGGGFGALVGVAQGFDFFAAYVGFFGFFDFFYRGFVGFTVFALGFVSVCFDYGFSDWVVIVFGYDDFVFFVGFAVDVVGAHAVVAFGVGLLEAVAVAALADDADGGKRFAVGGGGFTGGNEQKAAVLDGGDRVVTFCQAA